MMIPFWSDYFDEGYLQEPPFGTLLRFFPNCNMAVRRQVLEEIGGYDIERNAGEDADLCQRALHGGWELYFSRRAECRHEARPNFRSLIRQYFFYGYHFAALYRKYREHKFEVLVSLDPRPRNSNYYPLLQTTRIPLPVLVFISWFSVFLLLATTSLALLAAGFYVGTLAVLAAALLIFAGLFWRGPFRSLGVRRLCVYLFVTCVINSACTAGSLAGGIRNRMLFHYPGI